jgi:hypothetical protein
MALQEFISRIRGSGLARPNKYSVRIMNPPVGRDENVEMVAESVSFPGQNLRSSTDLLRYGPQREIAHAMTYGPFNITFMCTTGMPEKLWFESWQDEMVNKDTWQAKFYDEYVADIELISLDQQDRDRYVCSIYEAYPKTITAQDFSYGSNGAYQTISIEFTYRWWDAVTTAVAPTKNKVLVPRPSVALDRHPQKIIAPISEASGISEDIWVVADPETRESTDPWTISQQREQGFN